MEHQTQEPFWIKSYPLNVEATIKPADKTLDELFEEACSKYSNNKCVSCHNTTFTFKEIKVLVDNFAASLINLGIKKGDRVAVIMPNLIQYPIVIFAILKIGAVVVNVNPLYTDSEMEYILKDSGSKAAVILDMMARKLNKLYKKDNLQHIIVTKVPDCYPMLTRLIMNFVIKYIQKVDVSYDYEALKFVDLIKSSSANNLQDLVSDNDIDISDLAFLQYTGATTGKPKGAMLTHKNIVSNIRQIHSWIIPQTDDLSKQIVIDALPLYHIFSLTANLFTFFFSGSENVMIPNPRDLKYTLKVLKKVPFTIFNALDTLYNHLLNSEEFMKNKYPSFKYSVAGGMPASRQVMEKWYQHTSVMPSNCYGLTEASPAVTMNPFSNTFDGSVGLPIPSTLVEIRDIKEAAKSLEINEIGLIFIKGPQVMDSYWNNPEQTKASFDKDGWFNTQDLGYLDERGKLYITGRLSELIIVSGFNVYPKEVETVIESFEGINEVAIFGVPSANTGESVIAYVSGKDGLSLKANEIRERCRTKLASYKLPSEIIIIKELPKTLVGKIDKVTLKKQFLTARRDNGN